MTQRFLKLVLTAALVIGLLGPGAAAATYDYGKYKTGSSGSGEEGFFFLLEPMLANPRNTDAAVATSVTSGGAPALYFSLIPDWDGDFAGRLTAGYSWGGGKKIYASVWTSTSEQTASGTPIGADYFITIGPPLPVGDGSISSYTFATEITASTADIGFAKTQEMGDGFEMEWAVSLRYANFEETMDGVYAGVQGYVSPIVALKRNEGDMVGARVGVRGRYFMTESLSATASLGMTVLDGELTAVSSLTQSGLTTPESFSSLTDDGRSGTIRDFDAALTWHSSSDSFRLSLGWEQQNWDGIAKDMMRFFPGGGAVLRERDSVAFSAYKLGMFFQF
jgi:hypothetical protein